MMDVLATATVVAMILGVGLVTAVDTVTAVATATAAGMACLQNAVRTMIVMPTTCAAMCARTTSIPAIRLEIRGQATTVRWSARWSGQLRMMTSAV